MPGQTVLGIDGARFTINDVLTYAGRTYRGWPIEGLLMNVRAVQATFDDLNPETRGQWAYPDTGVWDPERNLSEFLAVLPEWRAAGLLAFTVNLQGGSPEGYSRTQPWENSGFEPDGTLRPAYLDRLRRILDRADELGMVVIVGLFYQGQDERLQDEEAVKRAVDNASEWLLEGGWRNVILEIANECDVPNYEHLIIQFDRGHELVERAQSHTRDGRRLLVSTSYRGGSIPSDRVLRVADLALIHGNGVTDPAVMRWMVERTRFRTRNRPIPIVVNEDDHFNFDEPDNNMLAAVSQYASWGLFDAGEGSGGGGARSNYRDGYQLVPVNWSTNTPTKQGFFRLLRQVTGGA
ncbi:MAG: hypothetical protein AB7K36_15925 [Chloroflexota bacterium]